MDGTLHLQAVRNLFSDVAAFSRTHNVLIVIVYYSLIERDKLIVEALERLIEEVQLPFVNILKFYTERTGITLSTYRASEFDGHPSSLAHELAARCVTQDLLDRADLPRPGLFGKHPRQVLEAAVSDLVDDCVPVDVVLGWAQEAVIVKGRAARRRGRSGLAVASTEMSPPLADCQRRWRLARNVEAVIRAEPLPAAYLDVWLPLVYMCARNLGEFVFHFEKSADSDELVRLNNLFQEDGYFSPDRVSFFLGSARDEVLKVKARLDGLKVLHPDRFRCPDGWMLQPSSRLRDSLDLAAIRPELGLLHLDMVRFDASLRALEVLADRFDADRERPAVRRIWAIMLVYLRGFMNYLEQLERSVFEKAAIGLCGDAAMTCIDVTVEGGPDPEVAGHVCSLTVEADYLVPERGRLRELHWAGVAKDRAAYHFELPLMVLGTLRIGVAPNEPTRERFLRGTTRLAQIKIRNSTRGAQGEDLRAEDAAVSWADDDCRLAMVEFPGLLLLG